MGGHQQADWETPSKKSRSGAGNVGNSWSLLCPVPYTFLSLIKLSKESGTYRELNGFIRPPHIFRFRWKRNTCTVEPSTCTHV